MLSMNFNLGRMIRMRPAHWQISFLTTVDSDFPLLLWTRGLGRGVHLFRKLILSGLVIPGLFLPDLLSAASGKSAVSIKQNQDTLECQLDGQTLWRFFYST